MAVLCAGLCKVLVLLSAAGAMKEPGRQDWEAGNCGFEKPRLVKMNVAGCRTAARRGTKACCSADDGWE